MFKIRKLINLFVMSLVVLLAIVLTGCSGVANPDNYTIDKEVTVVKEKSLDEAKAEVEKVEEDDSVDNITMELKITSTSIIAQNVSATIKFSKKDGKINAAMEGGDNSASQNIYIKDSVMYIDGGILGKYKATIPSTEDYNFSEISEISIVDTVNAFNFETENLKVGYDKANCLVIDYATENVKFRFVADGMKPVYLYSEINKTVTEIKYTYDRVKINFPDDLDTNAINLDWAAFMDKFN